MNKRNKLAGAIALGTTLLACSSVHAGIFRAYLSATGSDTNTCTLQAPCRLLPAALAAVNDGGEIWMLDSANFNASPVSIDKSVSILAVPGTMGSVVGNGGDAIVIATPGVRVALRNLTLINITGGANGVRMDAGAQLVLEKCEVHGFPTAGVNINTAANVIVSESTLRGNGNGIQMNSGATTTISRSNLVYNQTAGAYSFPNSSSAFTVTHIRDSVLNGNTYGAVAFGNTGSSLMYVKNSDASGNSFDGFSTSGVGQPGSVTIAVSGSTANRNGRNGYASFAGAGTIVSDGTNVGLNNITSNANFPLGTFGNL